MRREKRRRHTKAEWEEQREKEMRSEKRREVGREESERGCGNRRVKSRRRRSRWGVGREKGKGCGVELPQGYFCPLTNISKSIRCK